ncbi:MAG: hypothetical protein AAFX99_15805 [Myxococcota bacterium]
MSIEPLLVLYILIGFGCATALVATQGWQRSSPLDLLLLIGVWPLFGPFVLTRHTSEPPHPIPPPMSNPDDPEDLLSALRHAGGGPLAALLPDAETGQHLARRLQVARERVREIDRLFTLEHYNEKAALAHQRELHACGDTRSAAMIDSRLQIIRRLRRLRERFNQDIHQIREILTQLHIQAELVRIAGTADRGTRDMVEELVERIQGLEEVMMEEEALTLEYGP